MFYVFLAEGFEETEALAPVDVMRRAKLDVKTVGVTGECVTSSHGVSACIVCTLEFLFKARKTGCLFAVKDSEMTEN